MAIYDSNVWALWSATDIYDTVSQIILDTGHVYVSVEIYWKAFLLLASNRGAGSYRSTWTMTCVKQPCPPMSLNLENLLKIYLERIF